MKLVKKILNKIKRNRYYRDIIFDSAFNRIEAAGKRILEIGPKDGYDSKKLVELSPEEFVCIDIPSDYTTNCFSGRQETREKLPGWFTDINFANKKYIEANLAYSDEEQLDDLGGFDIIWCTGVLYHNPEQLRFLRLLFDLLTTNGHMVLESSTTQHRKLRKHNCVEISWPKTKAALGIGESDQNNIDSKVMNSKYQSKSNKSNISHFPSKTAILSWMEMVGFKNIEIIDTGLKYRFAVLAQKTDFAGYTYSNRGPKPSPYYIGKAT